MVRALLNGTKTQTRRIVKPQPCAGGIIRNLAPGIAARQLTLATPGTVGTAQVMPYGDAAWCDLLSQHGMPGDRLWVKETHALYSLNFEDTGTWHPSDRDVCCHYREGCPSELASRFDRWKPSIFMPRWASRIDLGITSVRIERLNDISALDAMHEGIERISSVGFFRAFGWKDYSGREGLGFFDPRESYQTLWNSINLEPNPVSDRADDGKLRIVGYYSWPWSVEDFDAKYPGVRESRLYRGKPITVTANPWVWVVTFKPVSK